MLAEQYLIRKGDLVEVPNSFIKGNVDDIYVGSFIMLDRIGYFVSTKDETLADARIKRPINLPAKERAGWWIEWVGNTEKYRNKT